MTSWTLHAGDCRDIVRQIKPGSISAIVTDSPYELGFMGEDWDRTGVAFDAETWKLMVPLLAPGGALLSFGHAKLYHRLGVAIEDGGAEIRDSLHWIYGQGYPKGSFADKAIDAELGADRKPIRVPTKKGNKEPKKKGRPDKECRTWGDRVGGFTDKSKPVTEEAKRWEGWHTGLKPAHEPIVIARRPLEGNLARNLLTFGHGALNIAACRLGESGGGTTCSFYPEPCQGHENKVYGKTFHQVTEDDVGRWPPNVLFSHAPGCVQIGTRIVKGDARAGDGKGKGKRRGGFFDVGSEAGDTRPNGQLHGDEEVAVFDCAAWCPVAALDRQTGDLVSGFMPAGTKRQGTGYKGGLGDTVTADTYGDRGGASRFYPTFAWQEADLWPFRYVGKASERERQHGLGESFINEHSTVKPLALMQWLIRLVVPPGGIILDPFCGSGTTLVAADREGFRSIGIDIDPKNIALSDRRLQEDCPLFNRRR